MKDLPAPTSAVQTILVHVSGQDRPGLFAGILALLHRSSSAVIDVEQITIGQRLHLSLVVGAPPNDDVLKELLFFGWEHRLSVDFELVAEPPLTRRAVPWFVVTLLGAELGPAALGSAAEAIAGGGGNIERITCLARYPVRAYELTVSAPEIGPIRLGLLAASQRERFDVAVQRDGLSRRAIRLVALDVDSTLIQDEVIELLADEAGCGPEVAAITARAMAGELDFEAALRARVRLLAGLDVDVLERARKRLRLTPGARTFVRTLRRLGFTTMIVSGGFTTFTDALKVELGLDHAFANELGIVEGHLTGEVIGPVVDRGRKAAILAEVAAAEGVDLAQTVAVGDGANDLDMLAAAGLSIAFNAKPIVVEAADTALHVPYLDAVLFVLGIRHDDVEDADTVVPEAVVPEPLTSPLRRE